MNWQIILTSTVVATIVTSIFTLVLNVYLKKIDYKNEYYKKVIQKRIEAYEFLENQIVRLKQSTLDDRDGKAYHIIFAHGEEYYISSMTPTIQTSAYSLWIHVDTFEVFNKLKSIFFDISFSLNNSNNRNEDLIIMGKKYYREIALIRDELEQCVRNDYLNLHKIEEFGKKHNLASSENKFVSIKDKFTS